ncbi:MAG: hypothetical protein PHQ05_09990 [Sterolibacterium sp.]|nr:hypothetical protein [Sterolibacterium sp.]
MDMMAITQHAILPMPATYSAPELYGVLWAWYAGGVALLVLPWVFKRLFKDKDTAPLMMYIGGLICSLQEALLDTLGHLWWPANLPGPVYTAFDMPVPLLIPGCYVFFVAMTGYWAYTKMKQGIGVAGVFKVWSILALSDAIMEIPGTANGVYQYYGEVPFKILGFPLAWAWQNGTAMLMVGFLLWLVAPYLQQGWRRLLVILVTPVAFGASYGILGWPYFNALNWPMPFWAAHVWTFGGFVLSLIVVRFIAAVVAHASETHHQTAPLEALLGPATNR